MERIIRMALAAVAFLLIAPMMNASEKDGHVLTALWKQYEDASRADRPQKEAEILSKIKTEAQKQRLPVDFYDAATKYVGQAMVAPVKIVWDKKKVADGGVVKITAYDPYAPNNEWTAKAKDGNQYTGAEVTSEGFQIFGTLSFGS